MSYQQFYEIINNSAANAYVMVLRLPCNPASIALKLTVGASKLAHKNPSNTDVYMLVWGLGSYVFWKNIKAC